MDKLPLRPKLPKPATAYEGMITAKLESCSFSVASNRLMGVVVGSADKRFKDGQFIVTAPLAETLGTDLYRASDGSVYVVEWIDEVAAMDARLIEGAKETEVAPETDDGPWHYVFRKTAETYEEDCWKWYENGPTRYWKRIDNGYITPKGAFDEGWRYGGPAVW